MDGRRGRGRRLELDRPNKQALLRPHPCVARLDVPPHSTRRRRRPLPSVCQSNSVHRVDGPFVVSTASAQRMEARNSIGHAGCRGRSYGDDR